MDNVIGPGSPKYDDAYWEINSIRIFTTGTNTAPTQAADAVLANPTPAMTAAPAGGATMNNSAHRITVPPFWTALAAVALAFCAL